MNKKKLQLNMGNRFYIVFLLIGLFSCNDSNEVLLFDRDLNNIAVQNEMFFFDRVEIYNTHGVMLYEKILLDREGKNNLFLYQFDSSYLERGSKMMVDNDSLNVYLQVQIISKDFRSVEIYEADISDPSPRKVQLRKINPSAP